MRRLFDNPVFGYHAELALGWSEDQLVTTAKHLSAFLPGGLTRRMRMAIAAFAMSVVHAEQVFGLGVHYPRGKEAYRVPARYRYGGPYCTWHYITHSADCLHDAGFIKQSLGVWGQNGNGYESAAFSAPALTALIGPLITDLEVGGLTGPTESVVRRDARKKLMDYEDTAETCRMREELTTINESLARLEIRRNGARVPVPPVRRIFNESFERGGRLYCHGASHQNMPKEDRPDLEFVIDSVAHKVVEVDYSVLHVAMAYAKAGVDLPAGGPYEIEGYDRDVVKMAVNTIFNAGTRRSAIDAVTNKLAGGAARPGVRPWFSPVRPDAARLVEAVARKHDAINHLFGSDCGSRFQRTDSDMAVRSCTG